MSLHEYRPHCGKVLNYRDHVFTRDSVPSYAHVYLNSFDDDMAQLLMSSSRLTEVVAEDVMLFFEPLALLCDFSIQHVNDLLVLDDTSCGLTMINLGGTASYRFNDQQLISVPDKSVVTVECRSGQRQLQVASANCQLLLLKWFKSSSVH